jgi:type II secretory pathway component PulF
MSAADDRKRDGLPPAEQALEQGLAALALEMPPGRLQRVTARIAADLQAGKTLPEALASRAARVPLHYAALLGAGLRSGRLADVLMSMTAHARCVAELRATAIAALAYPALLLAVAFGIVAFGGSLLVPAFEKIFAGFRMKLPWLTETVVMLSRHRLYLFLPPLLLVGFLVCSRSMLRLSARGRARWARWLYAIPIAGTLIRSTRLAAFADLLAILVEHGVELPEAIRLAGADCADPLLHESSPFIEQDLRRGLPPMTALVERPGMPEVMAWIAGLAAEQGNLPVALRQLAELYRRQVEVRAALLKTVLSPFIVIVAVGIVAVCVLAAFMPLLALLAGLSGGLSGGKK